MTSEGDGASKRSFQYKLTNARLWPGHGIKSNLSPAGTTIHVQPMYLFTGTCIFSGFCWFAVTAFCFDRKRFTVIRLFVYSFSSHSWAYGSREPKKKTKQYRIHWGWIRSSRITSWRLINHRHCVLEFVSASFSPFHFYLPTDLSAKHRFDYIPLAFKPIIESFRLLFVRNVIEDDRFYRDWYISYTSNNLNI